MIDSILNRFRNGDRVRPERFWDGLTIEARQQILEQEGFSPTYVQELGTKKWGKLSEGVRIWLFSPVLLTALEVRQAIVRSQYKIEQEPNPREPV
jgi:hypothetical protein